MACKFLIVPIQDSEAAEAELNAFLQSHMDDMLLWGDSAAAMQTTLERCRDYLGGTLDLAIKPHPYINRTTHGVDFLGGRLLPDRVTLNHRSRVRFRRKMVDLEKQYLMGKIDVQELQDRATALIAFTRAAGAKSWNFRRAVLQQLPVSGRRPRTG